MVAVPATMTHASQRKSRLALGPGAESMPVRVDGPGCSDSGVYLEGKTVP